MPAPTEWMLAAIAALRARGQGEVQTRDSKGELKEFRTLEDAAGYALAHPDVWKICYSERDGTEHHLVRCGCECNYFYEQSTNQISLDQIADLDSGRQRRL